MSSLRTSAVLLAIAIAVGLSANRAGAQGIDKVAEPFVVRPALPFAPAPGVRPPVQLVPTSWVLHADRPIHVQLSEWATSAGWTLSWELEKSWRPPADATFTGPFDKALEDVVRSLFNEGKPVHLRVWDGNRVAQIVQSTPQ
jgi:hypothetical protein